MNKILSFMSLDFRLLKPYIKMFAIFIGLSIFASIASKSGATMYPFAFLIFSLINYLFIAVEKYNMDILYATLPIDRKIMVIGRYLFTFLFAIITSAISFCVAIITDYALAKNFNFYNNIFMFVLTLSLFLVTIGMQYPLYFKFDYTKTQWLGFIPFFAVALIGGSVATLNNHAINFSEILQDKIEYGFASCVSLLVAFAIFIVSCYLSNKIYKKRDI